MPSSPRRNEVAPSTPIRGLITSNGTHPPALNFNASASKSSASTSGAPPLPKVETTPKRDPATLVAKRMQHLQLHPPTNNSNNNALTMSPSPATAGNNNSGSGSGFVFSAQSPMRTFGNASQAGTPTRHYALTPVVNNITGTTTTHTTATTGMEDITTSNSMEEQLDFDLDLDLDALEDRYTAAAAATTNGGGEHLKFPAELCHDNFSARPVHPDGSTLLPPLAKRGLIPSIARKSSLGRNSNSGGWNNNNDRTAPAQQGKNTSTVHPIIIETPCTNITRAPELANFPPMKDPVPFPPSGHKGYSFTSMSQYEKRKHSEATSTANVITPPKVKQYQPSRQDSDFIEAVGNNMPKEDLNSIFTSRRTGNSALQAAFSSTDQEDDDDSYLPCVMMGEGGGGGTVQQLFQSIPMDDRQFSIPSIRMANQLGGGSLASCTTYNTDDDESLLMYRDDASLSSRGSFCNLEDIQAAFRVSLSGGAGAGGGDGDAKRQQSSSFESDDQQRPSILSVPSIGCASATDETDNMDVPVPPIIMSSASFPCPQQTATHNNGRRRSQKRKEQRDRNAFNWLRTVKAGTDEVAEAASSKFLTGGRHRYENNQDPFEDQDHGMLRERPQKRLSALPAVETTAFAMLKDMAKDDPVSFGSSHGSSSIHRPQLAVMMTDT